MNADIGHTKKNSGSAHRNDQTDADRQQWAGINQAAGISRDFSEGQDASSYPVEKRQRAQMPIENMTMQQEETVRQKKKTGLFGRVIAMLSQGNGDTGARGPKTSMPSNNPFDRQTRAQSASHSVPSHKPSKKATLTFSTRDAFVVTLDRDGRLVSAPSDIDLRFAIAIEPGLDRFADVFLPEERSRIINALVSPDARIVSGRARQPDGTISMFDMHVAQQTDGMLSLIVVDTTAVTEERHTLQQAAEKSRADAKASAAALADLSHEMKTPLNAVIGFAEAMSTETFGPMGHQKYHEYANDIRNSGRHLLDLVVTILDMARLDAERLELTPVLCQPAELARECAAMVRQAAEAAGLELLFEIDENQNDKSEKNGERTAAGNFVNEERMMDPRAIRQVLINLLTNAIKFTSDGTVRLSLSATEEETVFEVSDTGVGMSPDALASLGPRFTDAHGAGVRGTDGAGLGLALAYRLAALHDGRLDLDSAPGEGLTARLVIPKRKTPTRRNPQDAAPSTSSKSGNGASSLQTTEEPAPMTTSTTAANKGKSVVKPRHTVRYDQLTQLERIEAYRQEVLQQRQQQLAGDQRVKKSANAA
ncbi:MAG: HAMP domain-containing sensor histidine kinase [Pseudomonadota bacterium]